MPNANGTMTQAERKEMEAAEREKRRKIAKQERARLRRASQHVEKVLLESTGAAGHTLKDEMGYGKPIEEWDLEELAHGRPRFRDGTFRTSIPPVIPRIVYEEAIKRFTDHANEEMRALVPEALKTIFWIITNEDTDRRGKPYISATVKFQASAWVIEHLVGKARQPVDLDISVKLQGILANVMVSPGEQGQLMPSVALDYVDAEVVDEG